MTTEQSGVPVYRDDEGNLYVRVPDQQKDEIAQALAAQQQDTAGYLVGAGLLYHQLIGSLVPAGVIFDLPDRGGRRGIIIVGGRFAG